MPLSRHEEEIAPLKEFEPDEGERLRPFGADRATCVITSMKRQWGSSVR